MAKERMDNSGAGHGNGKRTNNYWYLAAWNVQGLTNKIEVPQEFGKFKIDVTVLSETKKKGESLLGIGKLFIAIFRN